MIKSIPLENFSYILILFHATLGSIALIAGTASLFVPKGKKWHKLLGNIFYYAMLISALSALIIALLPKHSSIFLFVIGLFSSYFILSGKRALRFKSNFPTLIDTTISFCMLIISIFMVLHPIILQSSINIVLLIFGILGVILTLVDLKNYKNPKNIKKKWLKLHISKMMGGYISAFTAFIVANQIINGYIGWVAPGIIGGFYIFYWMKKLNKGHIK